MSKLSNIVVILLFLFLLSCGKEEVRQTIPFAHVHFRIDLNGHDHALRNPLAYKFFLQGRLQTDRVGYGGLLVVSSIDGEQLFAFDLACPCQRRPDIRVVPTANGTAVCTTCNSVFITSFGLGTVQSGTTRAPLQRYVVQRQSPGVFLIRN